MRLDPNEVKQLIVDGKNIASLLTANGSLVAAGKVLAMANALDAITGAIMKTAPKEVTADDKND